MKHYNINVNGIDIHYVRQGVGRPLILLHGWPEFWYTWHKIIPTLADSFDVIVPDLRGFGQSEKPSGSAEKSYSLPNHVADLKCLADELELNQFGIVSHDVGSSIAQQFARENPERISGLFFFNLSYPGIGSRWAAPDRLNAIWYQGFHLQPWAVELLNSSREAVRVYIGNLLTDWAYDDHVFDNDLDDWVDNFSVPGNIQGGFNWYISMFPLRLAMAKGELPPSPPIKIPTCVRWGEEDPVMLVEFADLLPDYFLNLDFKTVPNSGHFVHYEQPDYASNEIQLFFESKY